MIGSPRGKLVAHMGLTSKVSRYYYMVGAWTLTDDLKRRFDSFGTSSLRKILGYQWFDFKSNY